MSEEEAREDCLESSSRERIARLTGLVNCDCATSSILRDFPPPRCCCCCHASTEQREEKPATLFRPDERMFTDRRRRRCCPQTQPSRSGQQQLLFSRMRDRCSKFRTLPAPHSSWKLGLGPQTTTPECFSSFSAYCAMQWEQGED